MYADVSAARGGAVGEQGSRFTHLKTNDPRPKGMGGNPEFPVDQPIFPEFRFSASGLRLLSQKCRPTSARAQRPNNHSSAPTVFQPALKFSYCHIANSNVAATDASKATPNIA